MQPWPIVGGVVIVVVAVVASRLYTRWTFRRIDRSERREPPPPPSTSTDDQ